MYIGKLAKRLESNVAAKYKTNPESIKPIQ